MSTENQDSIKLEKSLRFNKDKRKHKTFVIENPFLSKWNSEGESICDKLSLFDSTDEPYLGAREALSNKEALAFIQNEDKDPELCLNFSLMVIDGFEISLPKLKGQSLLCKDCVIQGDTTKGSLQVLDLRFIRCEVEGLPYQLAVDKMAIMSSTVYLPFGFAATKLYVEGYSLVTNL